MLLCVNSSYLVLLSSILWYGYSTVCLVLHSLKDIWVVSSFGLFQKKASVNVELLDISLGMDINAVISFW